MLFDTVGDVKISRGGKTLAPGPSDSLGAHSAQQAWSGYSTSESAQILYASWKLTRVRTAD